MTIYKEIKIIPTQKKGDSWPVMVETESGNYLVKLSGSGHGIPALVSEIISSNIAKSIGINVPDLALIKIDNFIIEEKQDPELIALLRASQGLNVGLKIISGARDFQVNDMKYIGERDATLVFWFDWFVMNPDRTVRNPNMMMKNGKLWLIDHGSSLMFHHSWDDVNEDSPKAPWIYGKDHIFAEKTPQVLDLHNIISNRLERNQIRGFVENVPTSFFEKIMMNDESEAIQRRKEAYVAFLWKRLKSKIRFDVC